MVFVNILIVQNKRNHLIPFVELPPVLEVKKPNKVKKVTF